MKSYHGLASYLKENLQRLLSSSFIFLMCLVFLNLVGANIVISIYKIVTQSLFLYIFIQSTISSLHLLSVYIAITLALFFAYLLLILP